MNGIPDNFLIKGMQFGLNRIAVGRRCIDHAQVARPHQRKLQCPRNGRGSQGQGINIHLQFLQLFLCCHAKFLLLVNDHQAEVFELHILANQSVCPDQDVNFSRFQIFQCAVLLFGALEPVDVIHPAGKLFQAFAEGTVMLQSQNGCRHQHCHLLTVGYRLKGRTHGNFGFPETHIPAYQAVHGIGLLHIALDVRR